MFPRAVSSRTRRPQRGAGEGGQPGDGRDVGPGASGEQVGDGLPVDAGAVRHRPQAQAPLVKDAGEGAGDLPDGFGGGVGAGLLGPGFRVVGELPRGACAGASADNVRTILSVEVDHLWNGCLSSRYAWTVVLDPAMSAKITRYRPRNPPAVWGEVAPLVRSVVAATVTAVPYNVERLLHITGRLALWAEAAGLERDPDAWLRNEVIDAFVLSLAAGIEASTVRTYRTWLLRVRDALSFSERGEAARPDCTLPSTRTSPIPGPSWRGCGTGRPICRASSAPTDSPCWDSGRAAG